MSSDPARKPDMKRCADLAVETIRRFGGQATIYETKGNPLVHGIFPAGKDLPTVTVYNHMDVQPASRETEPWDTEPFTFTKKGDRYFGRGTTDDKGPALSALLGVRAAREAGVPLNINVLWELEEEIGSPNFEAGIVEKTEGAGHGLGASSRDTIWVSRERPACSGRAARPAGLHASRWRRDRPTSTPAPPAAPRAIRSAS